MFASANFFFVPADRQIHVFFDEDDARAKVDVVGVFTQLENVSTDYTLDVHGRELNLDLEFPNADDRLPVDEAIPEWTAAITEHIAPYLKDGVVTPHATFGEITVDDRGNGIWFLARNNESVTLNNEHYIPDADCQYWVGYSKSCGCCGGTPDFELVGVDSSVLNVPEGVTLGEHLIPFIEVMEAQYRARAQDEMANGGLGELFRSFGMGDRLQAGARKHRTVVHHAVAGEGAVAIAKEPNEVGRIIIAGEPVMVLYPNHSIVFGKRSTDDHDSEVDVDSDLRKSLSRRIQRLTRIPFENITVETFNIGMMRDVMWRAMAGNYQDNGMVDHQLYHTARSVATPGKVNWWLRVLVNGWFMHLTYPRQNVLTIMASQISELTDFMDIDSDDRDTLIAQLTVVIEYWYANKDKQG